METMLGLYKSKHLDVFYLLQWAFFKVLSTQRENAIGDEF